MEVAKPKRATRPVQQGTDGSGWVMNSEPSKGKKGAMATTKDPVCGMNVQPERAAGRSEYKGETYYFCAPGCKRRFDEAPEQFVHAEKPKSWFSWLTGR